MASLRRVVDPGRWPRSTPVPRARAWATGLAGLDPASLSIPHVPRFVFRGLNWLLPRRPLGRLIGRVAMAGLTLALEACVPATRAGGLAPTLTMSEVAGGTVAMQDGIPVPSFEIGPRPRIDLDGAWRAQTATFDSDVSLTPRDASLPRIVAQAGGRQNPEFDDSTWPTVNVPGTVNAPPNRREIGAWYRRSFALPADWAGRALTLKFEAVNYIADVWLNGKWLGYHEGGYTPFAFDATAAALPGQPNVLVVRVDNPPWGSRNDIVPWGLADWWNFGGITRSVWLEASDPLHVVRTDVVPHLDGADVSIVLENRSDTPAAARPVVQILSARVTAANLLSPDVRALVASPVPIATEALDVQQLRPRETIRLDTSFVLGAADHWAPASPALYVARVVLLAPPAAPAEAGGQASSFASPTLAPAPSAPTPGPAGSSTAEGQPEETPPFIAAPPIVPVSIPPLAASSDAWIGGEPAPSVAPSASPASVMSASASPASVMPASAPSASPSQSGSDVSSSLAPASSGGAAQPGSVAGASASASAEAAGGARAAATDEAGRLVPFDEIDESFGLRQIAVDPSGPALRLNGRTIVFDGVNLHDQRVEPSTAAIAGGIVATLPDPAEILAQLQQARKVNALLIRTGHAPADPALLRLADRLGFGIWEEIPLYHYTPLTFGIAMDRGIPQQMLREMVLRDMNNPSVLFHGLANESTGGPERASALAELSGIDHQLDGTRLTGQAAYGFSPTDDTSASLDVVGFTFYYGVFYGSDPATDTGRALDEMHAAYPTKPILMLEFGRWADPPIGTSEQVRIFDATTAAAGPRLAVRRGGFVAARLWWSLEDYLTMRPQIEIERFGMFAPDGSPRPVASAAIRVFGPVSATSPGMGSVSSGRQLPVAEGSSLRLVEYLAYGAGVSIAILGAIIVVQAALGGRAGARSKRAGASRRTAESAGPDRA